MNTHRALLLSALAMILTVAVLAVTVAPYAWEAVETLDGDVALRLDRVMELHGGGAWYDSVAERLDAPFGELVNWSRPLDVMLYAGAAVGALFTDFRTALIGWAWVFSPLLLLACLPVLRRTIEPVLGAWGLLAGVVLLLLQVKFVYAFVPGRADHHSLMALLFLTMLLGLARAALGDLGRRPAVVAGLAAGFACWVSVESMVAAAFGGAAWLMLWVWENDRRRLDQIVLYAGLATAVLVVAVAAEHPPQDWLRELHAKVSVVHLSLAALATLAVALLRWLDGLRPTDCGICRATRAALLMNAAAIAAVLLFPALLAGPLAADGAETSRWHLEMVGEFQRLVPEDALRSAMFALHLGLPLIAVLGSLALLRRRPLPERKLLAVCLLGLLLYVPLTMAQVRWANYPQMLMVLPVLMLVREVMNSRLRLRAVAATALLLAPYAAMLAFGAQAPRAEEPAAETACDKSAILRHLARQAPPPGEDILFTYVSDGPEVIWNSRYRVVASNYLFDTGFGQAVDAFLAETDQFLRELVERRGVSWVLVCAGNPEARLYRNETGRSLHDRLAAGEAPEWLRPVPLPEHLKPHLMYRVATP